jgi:cobalamin 5'-phosphate synthase/cobalamin synthase
MIRQFAAAVSFLTGLPVGSGAVVSAKDVARSAGWFPLAGALIGGFYVAALFGFRLIFTPLITSALIAAIGAFLTGALHLDGLADTADGFGAGRTPGETLRIMRDPAIGSYGAVALVLAIILKIAAMYALVDRAAWRYFVLAPSLARWPLVTLSAALPYARTAEDGSSKGALSRLIGRRELIISTAIALFIAALTVRWQAILFYLLIVAVTFLWGLWCMRRIHGITGDTLGAAAEISEIAVLMAAAALVH